jgi:o-succinylbenzoate synthase
VIEGLDLRPYRLPLRRGWQSARGTLAERAGWVVRARADGHAGLGDCAPLPAAGTETAERALEALLEWRRRLSGCPLETAVGLVGTGPTEAPAARFAVECALLDLAARRAGVPLRRWLKPRAADSVEVNAALGALRGVTPATLQQKLAAGFRIIKIKVGLEEPRSELERLSGLADGLPAGAGLRLDANGAWTLEQARRVVDRLNGLPIESLEEPLREPRYADLRRLQSAARFPLALDETLHRPGRPIELETLPLPRIVLKPAVLGGLRRTLETAERAQGLGIGVVLTSLIESAAGLWPSLQLAAAVPSCLAHGLATSEWLARDLGDAPVVRRGRIRLPERAGSGFRPGWHG